MTIETAGFYPEMPMDQYIGDPCPEPSVSTGVIQRLLEQTPLHAHTFHPRLGGQSDGPSVRSELGQAIHAAVLGGASIECVAEVTRRSGPNKGEKFEPTDWATKDAQEARDAIRARGNIPMLPFQVPAIEAMLASVTRTLSQFGPGKTEQTMLWREENGVWCRGRPDFMTDDDLYDIDLKSCANADPASWIKSTLVQGGYDIQAGLRMRGHHALTGRNRDVLFLLVEIEPPYACSVVGLDPAFQDLAARKVQRGIDLWGKCLKASKWPGYDERVHYAEPPGWAEYSFESRSAA